MGEISLTEQWGVNGVRWGRSHSQSWLVLTVVAPVRVLGDEVVHTLLCGRRHAVRVFPSGPNRTEQTCIH